ncbi:MAG: NUDIX domain-containing protein [Polyangiales bacterium]
MTVPRTPLLATDIIIELHDRPGHPIVLIERKHEPLGWALPGGFVDEGESVEAAAVREAAEEVNLEVTLTKLLGVYSDPDRDPRGHAVSVVWVAVAGGDPVPMDDAVALRTFDLDKLPSALAFDHARILEDYREYRNNGTLPAPALVGPTRPIA